MKTLKQMMQEYDATEKWLGKCPECRQVTQIAQTHDADYATCRKCYEQDVRDAIA